jgi:hypothetical protein
MTSETMVRILPSSGQGARGGAWPFLATASIRERPVSRRKNAGRLELCAKRGASGLFAGIQPFSARHRRGSHGGTQYNFNAMRPARPFRSRSKTIDLTKIELIVNLFHFNNDLVRTYPHGLLLLTMQEFFKA